MEKNCWRKEIHAKHVCTDKVDKEEMEKIETVMAMIKMFENDQISEEELLQILSKRMVKAVSTQNAALDTFMHVDA